MRSFVREPLVHFLALGAALFLYASLRPGSAPPSHRIVLTSGRIDHLAAAFTQARNRPPTEGELKGLIDDWVREEMAVREGTAAGLDRDDTIVRRRIRQKMEFLAEEAAASEPPTEAELGAWLDAHPDDFRRDAATAFRQVFFRDEPRARELAARLARSGAEAAVDDLGDPTLLPPEVGSASPSAVAALFGPELAASIGGAPLGVWSGPFASTYGWHVVFVRDRSEGSLPPLAAIRGEVERRLLAERRLGRIDAMYERLLKRYTVVVEKPEGRR